jgi:hypothetical protein
VKQGAPVNSSARGRSLGIGTGVWTAEFDSAYHNDISAVGDTASSGVQCSSRYRGGVHYVSANKEAHTIL